MDNQIRVIALVGSLRRDSYTRRVVNASSELAPEAMAIEIAPIGCLPLYNQDDETDVPRRASVSSGKPAAVLSVSPGSLGGFGANHHLRQCLTFLDMPVLQQPEAYIGSVASLADCGGRITQSDTVEFLKSFVDTRSTSGSDGCGSNECSGIQE